MWVADCQYDCAQGMTVTQGTLPLVVEADSADIIATIIQLKGDIEVQTGIPLKVVISGGAESHIVAKELGEASVGVILKPPRPYVGTSILPRCVPLIGRTCSPQNGITYASEYRRSLTQWVTQPVVQPSRTTRIRGQHDRHSSQK